MPKRNAKVGDSAEKAVMKTYPSKNTMNNVKITSMMSLRSGIAVPSFLKV
jgi:hypothetical protein